MRAAGGELLGFISQELVFDNSAVGFPNAHGVAIYLPQTKIDPAHGRLAWAQSGRWEGFLRWMLTPAS